MHHAMQMNHDNYYDIIVIGAGLAGLTAGLYLQREGYQVLILDKRAAAGGLCGTSYIDGYEFVIGCNEFGLGIERIMRELDIPITFEKKLIQFFFEHGHYQMPPNFSTTLKLLRHANEFFRFIRAALKKSNAHRSLEDLTNENVKNPELAEFIKMFAYPFAMSPRDVYMSALKEEFSKQYNYGKNQCLSPIGGPQKLVDQMVDKFCSLGGKLQLDMICSNIERVNHLKQISTNRGQYLSHFIISSEGRWDQYSPTLKAGLSASKILVALKKTVPFPKNVHAMVCMPNDISSWMNQIDNGESVQEFGFHLLHSNINSHPDYYTANIYFFLPRGLDNPDQTQIDKIEAYIFNKTEQMLPGFEAAVLYKQFISPKRFYELYGLSSKVTPIIMPAGFQKPSSYDPERDIYYVGNTVHPRGEHSGGAMLSGIYAAQQIKEAMKLV